MRLHTAHGSVIKTGRADQTSKKIAREIRGAVTRQTRQVLEESRTLAQWRAYSKARARALRAVRLGMPSFA
jgi:hypothetical protein